MAENRIKIGRAAMKRILVTFLALVSVAIAFAGDANSGYYQGHFFSPHRSSPGNIGVSLCIQGNSVWGSYFYMRAGNEIQLQGSIAPDGNIQLEELLPTGKVNGTWSGRMAETFKGIWKSPKGDEYNFELVRVGAIPADSDVSGPAKGGERYCSEIGYRMRRVSPSREDYFPRLVRFGNRKVMAGVNARLDAFCREWFARLESDAREYCAGGETEPYYEAQAGVEYASQDVFSIRVSGEYSCNGPAAAVTRYNDSKTFDLRTGEQVLLADLFKPDVPWKDVFRVLFAYQIAEAAKAGADESLRQYNPENLNPLNISFFFSDEGLVVAAETYGLTSPVQYCEQEVTVPYAVLRRLAAPESVLARAATAAAGNAPVRYRIRDWSSEKEIVYEPPGDY
jgi:hypothetical protein